MVLTGTPQQPYKIIFADKEYSLARDEYQYPTIPSGIDAALKLNAGDTELLVAVTTPANGKYGVKVFVKGSGATVPIIEVDAMSIPESAFYYAPPLAAGSWTRVCKSTGYFWERVNPDGTKTSIPMP